METDATPAHTAAVCLNGSNQASAAAATPTAASSPSMSRQQQEAALQALLSATSLSFDAIYAPIMRQWQQNGECTYDWTSVRHLLALRFQSVYESYVASSAAPVPPSSATPASTAASTTDDSDVSWMCEECREAVAKAVASSSGDAAQGQSSSSQAAAASVHCRRSALDEEPDHVRFQRMMHMLMAFYKPPFTFQRMCDLLLEPRRYCKTLRNFLQSFSKLVCGISSEVMEDRFDVNWNEQKDLTLGVPNVEFVTREEDEFGAIPAMMQTETNMADQGADAHTTASAAATFGVLTHAVLPPQHHRLGLTSSQRREMNEREREARERAARRIPGLGMPAAQEEEVEEEEETQEQERQQEVQHNQDGGESATIVEDDDPVKEWQEQPTQQQQQQQENQQGQSGAVPMEASD